MVRWSWSWMLGLVAAGAGCSFDPPAATDRDGGPDPDTPLGCDGPCAGGTLVPSNVTDLGPLAEPDLPDLVLDDRDQDAEPPAIWRIYTDTGEIQFESDGIPVLTTYRSPGEGKDPTRGLTFRIVNDSLAVLYVKRLEVPAGISLEGYGDRALVIVAKDAIEIGGEIDFSGGFADPGLFNFDFTRGGPGGGDGAVNNLGPDTVATGCGPGLSAPGDRGGGGGGGGGTAGGGGGEKDAANPGGGAGAACIPDTLVPLVGGSGGGSGDPAKGGGHGGGGGGALQLTSFVSVEITGILDLGGKGGFGQLVNDEGGGGGGAGGGLLLEAPVVMIAGSAILAANGGGGGAGRQPNNGDQGTLTSEPALGGEGDANGDGDGGDGAAGTTAATPGDNANGAGGGGGGAGVIRIHSDSGATSTAGAIVSPAAKQGRTTYAP